jgi:hypothetical protein
MTGALANRSYRERSISRIPSTKAIMVGFISGLAGTVVMDPFGAGMFLALGGPASLSFSVIGDAAVFFSLLGIQMAGGVPLVLKL